MNPERTKDIIQTLADGIAPYTCEQFPPDSPYQRADTVRALFTILESAERHHLRLVRLLVEWMLLAIGNKKKQSVVDCDRN